MMRNRLTHSRFTLSGAVCFAVIIWGIGLSAASDAGASSVNCKAKLRPRTDLAGCKFSSRELKGADLLFADLDKANLAKSNLSHVDLTGANLTGADLKKDNLSNAALNGGPISSSFNTADMPLTELNLVEESADRNHGDVPGTDLRRANLSGAYATNVFFPVVTWPRYEVVADAKSVAKSVTLSIAGISAALPNPNFAFADLAGANLAGVFFPGANLSNANLSGTNLSDADLIAANMSDVNLNGSDMKGASLDLALLTGAKTDSATTCPDGKRGPCQSL
jgi:uncharacterized protein YjbI with pentapeptide repeats